MLGGAFIHNPDAISDKIHVEDATDSHIAQEEPPTRDEIRKAIKSMKCGKSPGIDEITSEVLKAAGEPMVEMLKKISDKVWNEVKCPKGWSKMIVSPIHKRG